MQNDPTRHISIGLHGRDRTFGVLAYLHGSLIVYGFSVVLAIFISLASALPSLSASIVLPSGQETTATYVDPSTGMIHYSYVDEAGDPVNFSGYVKDNVDTSKLAYFIRSGDVAPGSALYCALQLEMGGGACSGAALRTAVAANPAKSVAVGCYPNVFDGTYYKTWYPTECMSNFYTYPTYYYLAGIKLLNNNIPPSCAWENPPSSGYERRFYGGAPYAFPGYGNFTIIGYSGGLVCQRTSKSATQIADWLDANGCIANCAATAFTYDNLSTSIAGFDPADPVDIWSVGGINSANPNTLPDTTNLGGSGSDYVSPGEQTPGGGSQGIDPSTGSPYTEDTATCDPASSNTCYDGSNTETIDTSGISGTGGVPNETHDVGGLLGFGAGWLPRSCPSPVSLSVMGADFDVSYQPICDFAGMISGIIKALALLSALGIVFTGGSATKGA